MKVTKEIKEFIKEHNLTLNQFYGIDIIEGSLYLRSLTSIPEGFNPTVGGGLFLRSLTSIPEGFNPTVGGSLYLRSLTSIPEGFNPTVGGDLFLDFLTSIPEGFNPTVGGSLYLESLTSIPVGFNPTVGGDLDLRSLTSIPEGFNPTVGGYLYLRSITSIPKGFNQSDYENKDLNYIEYPNTNYISVDGIFCEKVYSKGKAIKCKKINKEEYFYVVTDGNGTYAHGETIQEAKVDLKFKITKKYLSVYKNIDKDKKYSYEDCIVMYRSVTGACQYGVKQFIENNKIKKKSYSVNEIIKLTEGNYGNNAFIQFFN